MEDRLSVFVLFSVVEAVEDIVVLFVGLIGSWVSVRVGVVLDEEFGKPLHVCVEVEVIVCVEEESCRGEIENVDFVCLKFR